MPPTFYNSRDGKIQKKNTVVDTFFTTFFASASSPRNPGSAHDNAHELILVNLLIGSL